MKDSIYIHKKNRKLDTLPFFISFTYNNRKRECIYNIMKRKEKEKREQEREREKLKD